MTGKGTWVVGKAHNTRSPLFRVVGFAVFTSLSASSKLRDGKPRLQPGSFPNPSPRSVLAADNGGPDADASIKREGSVSLLVCPRGYIEAVPIGLEPKPPRIRGKSGAISAL